MPTFIQLLTHLALGALAFAAAALYDYVEAYYVRVTSQLRPHPAARMSVAMYLVGFVGWAVTVKVSLWYCLPEAIGVYLGSWYAVERQRRRAALEDVRAACDPPIAHEPLAAGAAGAYLPDQEDTPCPCTSEDARFPKVPASWN